MKTPPAALVDQEGRVAMRMAGGVEAFDRKVAELHHLPIAQQGVDDAEDLRRGESA